MDRHGLASFNDLRGTQFQIWDLEAKENSPEGRAKDRALAGLRPAPLPQARVNHWLVVGSNARGDWERRTLGHCKLKCGGPFAKSVSSFSLGRFSLSSKEESTWSQWASEFRFPRGARSSHFLCSHLSSY